MGQEQPDRGLGEIDFTQITAPASRPVLLTNNEELAAIKSKIEDPAFKWRFDAVCELALANPADVTSPFAAAADVDPRLFDVGWQLMGLESVLPAAGVAWQLTRDNKYLEHASKLLQKALDWPQWSDGRHATVDGYYNAAPETASGIRAFTWALDLFSGGLSRDLEWACQRRLAFLVQRLFEISREGGARWAANPSDDWSAAIHSAVGEAALLLWGVDERAENWLKLSIDKVLSYLESLPRDGGHPSGVTRWEFSLTYICIFLEELYRFSGNDLRRHPAIERTRRFAVRCLAPGAQDIVQIDQGLPLNVSNVCRGPLAKLLTQWFSDPVLSWARSNTAVTGFVRAMDLLWYDDSVPQVSPGEADECSVAFTDIGWVVMRSGWSEYDNLVAFKSAPYWPGYHHLDQNSFEIFARGKELAMDSGLGWRAHPNYFDRYRDSMAHNVVLVNGHGQLKHSPDSYGNLLNSEISEYADYVVGECAQAYDDVRRFTRAILFLKPDVIVLRDIIDLERPQSLDWLLHGAGNFEMTVREPGRGFSLGTEQVTLHSFIIEPNRWKHTLRRGYKLEDWRTRHETTHPVLVLTPDKSDHYEFVMVMKISDPDQPREFPGEVAEDGTMLLQAGGRRWQVKLAGGGTAYSLQS